MRAEYNGQDGFPNDVQPPLDLKFTVCNLYPMVVKAGPGVSIVQYMVVGVVPDRIMAKLAGLVSIDMFVNVA